MTDVGIMNQYFGTQYSQEDLQQRLAQRRSHTRDGSQRALSLSMVSPVSHGGDDMDMSGMVGGGDTLDDIIMQNNKEIQRRQSLSGFPQQEVDRRASMMEFGSSNNG